jgi:predicted ATPase with chaperone activity
MATKYQKRISGPLLDRIDSHVEVPQMDYEKLSSNKTSETSDSIPACVQAAADLAGSDEIQSVHPAEALQYRPKLMFSWVLFRCVFVLVPAISHPYPP